MESSEERRPSNVPSESPASPVEEIKIYCKVIKTVAMKVKRSKTIKGLKVMLCENECVPEKFQELFLSGERLEDGHTLIDYGINNDSSLSFVIHSLPVMKLVVKIPSKQKIIVLEGKIWDTFRNIKTMIQTKEGIQSDQFSLYLNGEQVNDDSTLASHNIQRALYLILNPGDVMSICVKKQTGSTERLKVGLLHTVEDIKGIIESRTSILVHEFRLSYAGMVLKGCKTLGNYDIKEESLLEISPLIPIFVKNLDGKRRWKFMVDLGDTVGDLMEMIFLETGYPVEDQGIVFAGKHLKKEQALANCDIKKDSSPILVVRRRG